MVLGIAGCQENAARRMTPPDGEICENLAYGTREGLAQLVDGLRRRDCTDSDEVVANTRATLYLYAEHGCSSPEEGGVKMEANQIMRDSEKRCPHRQIFPHTGIRHH